jgi:hypothetical protein
LLPGTAGLAATIFSGDLFRASAQVQLLVQFAVLSHSPVDFFSTAIYSSIRRNGRHCARRGFKLVRFHIQSFLASPNSAVTSLPRAGISRFATIRSRQCQSHNSFVSHTYEKRGGGGATPSPTCIYLCDSIAYPFTKGPRSAGLQPCSSMCCPCPVHHDSPRRSPQNRNYSSYPRFSYPVASLRPRLAFVRNSLP